MLRLVIEGAKATVTLSRPPVNAMNREWNAAFSAALDAIGRSAAVAVVIRSDQPAFSAGADIAEIRERMAEGGDAMAGMARDLQALFARLERLSRVTIAEIGGTAFGGGFELALACDLRVAAEEARMGLPEVRLGLLPGAGGTQRLTALCGPGTAARLILGAETVDGATARALGLVQWAVPARDLRATTDRIAASVAALPGTALAEAKGCIAARADPARDGFSDEVEATRRLLADPATRALVAAFLDRRKGGAAASPG